MHVTQLDTNEGAIFSRVLKLGGANLSTAAAKAILDFDFIQADKDRMRQLSAKAKEGSLSTREQDAINNYERVGHILSLMKSKARLSLKGRSTTKRKAKAKSTHGTRA